MPIDTPQVIALMPGNINVPAGAHLFVNVQVTTDGSPEGLAALPGAIEELVDILQTWTGRVADVTGQFYETTLAAVTPTNPDPDNTPDPEDPPPGE